jgi:hypothetical protein
VTPAAWLWYGVGVKPIGNGQWSGCGFGLLTAAIAVGLLTINGAVVAGIYYGLSDLYPAPMQNLAFGQLVIFLGAVALLFLQWTMLDYVVDRFRRPRHDGR